MAIRKTFRGDGAILFKDKEIAVTYVIQGYRDANIRRADGTADGIDPRDIMDLHSTNDIRLRMEDDTVVEIVFLGGEVFGPQRFAVNTPLEF